MIFITDWALIVSDIRRREIFVSLKNKIAPTDFYTIEGKSDIDRVGMYTYEFFCFRTFCHGAAVLEFT